MVSERHEAPRWSRFFCIAVSSVLFALSFGVQYGVSDQNLYLLPGLQRVDPTFLQNDWFVSQTVHPHKAFNHILFVLTSLGPLVWTTTALHLLSMALLAVSVYWILSALCEKPLLPFLASLPLLHIVIGSENLLSHAFFVPWLLPTNLAGTCFLTAIAVLGIAGSDHIARYGISGLFFGLSGLLHGTYLFLIPPFLMGMMVFLHRRLSYKHLLIFSIPFLIVTLPVGWQVLTQFALGGIEKDSLTHLDALARLRIPHHYLPAIWDREIFLTFGSHVFLGMTGLFLNWPSKKEAAVILAAMASLSAMLLMIFFFTVALFTPYVGLLQGYRFVSFLSIFSLLLFSCALAKEIEWTGEHSAYRVERILVICLGLFVVYRLDAAIGLLLSGLFSAGLLLSGNGMIADRFKSAIRSIFLAGAILFLGYKTVVHFPTETTLSRPMPASESALYNWVREHTEPDAIFVIPIELQRFRLYARRSIVVDWKGYPFRAEDVTEWFRRISMVCGVQTARSFHDLSAGYVRLDVKRAELLAKAFGAQYVVVRPYQHQGRLEDFKKVYAWNEYAIYRISQDRTSGNAR